ncbi:MAG: TetR/AcrR family transcriptional regulator [candidate division GAL15 bacterium]
MAQAQARPRHEELLAAAVRLFRHRGYHDTSMQDLAEAVGMQRGSLYHYIEAKEDLLWEIMDRAMHRLLGAVKPVAASRAPASEKLRRAIEAHLAVAAQHRDELVVLHVELKSLSEERRQRLLALRDRYEGLFRAMVAEGVQTGEFRPADPKTVGLAVLGACNWFTTWFRPEGPLSASDFARAFADLFLEGLVRTPHR